MNRLICTAIYFFFMTTGVFGAALSEGDRPQSEGSDTPSSPVHIYDGYEIKLPSEVDFGGRAVLSKNHKKLWSANLEGGHFYLGNAMDPDNKGIITDHLELPDGRHFFVLTSWSGGAHCCNTLYLLQTSPKFKVILQLDGRDYDFRIGDLNHDEIPEIQFADDAFNYVFTSFADSPAPKLILMLKGDQFVLAPDLMRELPLTDNQITSIRADLQAIFTKEGNEIGMARLLAKMTNLSYTGRHHQAFQLLEMTWPPKLKGKEAFIKKYRATLKKSRYWKKLKFDS